MKHCCLQEKTEIGDGGELRPVVAAKRRHFKYPEGKEVVEERRVKEGGRSQEQVLLLVRTALELVKMRCCSSFLKVTLVLLLAMSFACFHVADLRLCC